MLLPKLFSDNLFDSDWFAWPDAVEKRLYGKRAARMMRTDIREKDGHYLIDIDLPGFKKEDIGVHLENGYLVVQASKGLDKDEKDEKGKLIRQERYSGSMQRSFYVGESLKEEDVKARFENGVLVLDIPKEEEKLPEKKTIMIEG